ncbi:hypothetical protein FDZ74_04920, partial [bacterium]
MNYRLDAGVVKRVQSIMGQKHSIEQTLELFTVDPSDGVVILAGRALGGLHTPPFPPSMPALLTDLSDGMLADLQTVLGQVYPQTFEVLAAFTGPDGQLARKSLCLDELSAQHALDALLVPALGADTSLEAFQE